MPTSRKRPRPKPDSPRPRWQWRRAAAAHGARRARRAEIFSAFTVLGAGKTAYVALGRMAAELLAGAEAA